jgi:hypothetical protein
MESMSGAWHLPVVPSGGGEGLDGDLALVAGGRELRISVPA